MFIGSEALSEVRDYKASIGLVNNSFASLYTFILSSRLLYPRSAMTERSTEQNMADASKDAALPTLSTTQAPLPKKFPKGVVLGKDGKP